MVCRRLRRHRGDGALARRERLFIRAFVVQIRYVLHDSETDYERQYDKRRRGAERKRGLPPRSRSRTLLSLTCRRRCLSKYKFGATEANLLSISERNRFVGDANIFHKSTVARFCVDQLPSTLPPLHDRMLSGNGGIAHDQVV